VFLKLAKLWQLENTPRLADRGSQFASSKLRDRDESRAANRDPHNKDEPRTANREPRS
jgi:hypothetical protein